jgi:hypothetical protein
LPAAAICSLPSALAAMWLRKRALLLQPILVFLVRRQWPILVLVRLLAMCLVLVRSVLASVMCRRYSQTRQWLVRLRA